MAGLPNVIGYVAAKSNTEVNRGINAFTPGVQRVNPNAKVVVMWTGAWQDEDATAQGRIRDMTVLTVLVVASLLIRAEVNSLLNATR